MKARWCLTILLICREKDEEKKTPESDGRGKWLKHATMTTILVMSLFFLCYVSYWSICVEILIKYVQHFYLNKQVSWTFNQIGGFLYNSQQV